MSLKGFDLYKKHEQLAALKLETYNKIYKKCITTIIASSNMGELYCVFEIPNFLFGSSYPIINITSCANYIMKKLTDENKYIKVEFYEPNILFMDWRKDVDK